MTMVDDINISNVSFAEARSKILAFNGYAPSGPDTDIQDVSFILSKGGQTICVVPCFIRDGAVASHDGTSILPFYTTDDVSSRMAAADALMRRLIAYLENHDAQSCKILWDSEMNNAASKRNDIRIDDNTRTYGYYDLTKDNAEAWLHIRKSYRSLIRRGERELTRIELTSSNLYCPEINYFLLNSEGINAETIDAVHSAIAKGEGRLFVWRAAAKIIGIVGMTKWEKFSPTGDLFYTLGAYDHHGSCPANFCLYDALLAHKNTEWKRIFILHGTPTDRGPGSKLGDIDFFKRGYCTDFFTHDYKILYLSC
jgi:hypothetical protein